jgi:hypothetical protein
MMQKSTRPLTFIFEEPIDSNESDMMYLYSEGTYLLATCHGCLQARSSSLRRLFRYGLLLLIMLLCAVLLRAASFPVTNTNDSGPGSLRQAILDMNAAGAGPHTIVFNVYGQITLLSSLPAITNSDVTIDGENKITLNSNGTNPIINPFDIYGSNVTVRNFRITNNGDINVIVRTNTTGVWIENISTSSNTGNLLNSVIYVEGNSTNLTIRKIYSTDVEPCGGPYFGRAINITGGTHTNMVMDSIFLRTENNARGCEGIVFRDASINGLTLTNSHISGFENGIVLDNTGGPMETANNILIRNVTIDSLHSGLALGFYSDYVNTNIQIRNTSIDLDYPGTDDDGDYAIRFDNSADNIVIDSVNLNEADIRFLWFNGVASNITVDHTTIENRAPGVYGGSHFISFESTVTNLTIKNTVLNADKIGTTDDGDYGLVLIGAINGAVIDSCTFNEFDVDGIYVNNAPNTDFEIKNSRFTKNLDGLEFYGNFPRTNVAVTNNYFDGNERSGIVVSAANATSDMAITGDTVINSGNHGIWLYGGTAAVDVIISGCVIHDNKGAGINNDDPDKVIYTNNAIYNNGGLGIDNISGNCGYQGALRPVLVSSTPLGGGQYELVINLPNLVPTGYSVELYANDAGTSASSGQYFVTTLTGLNSGNNTRTVTYNTGPGATGVGFWTATMTIPGNLCGTSEFSDQLSLGVKAPACITNGIVAWYKADMGVNGMVWGDISGNGNNMTVVGDPDDTTGLVNFNKAFYYDGNDAHRAPASAGVTTAYTMMGLGRLEGSQNGRVFSSSTGNKLFGWHGNFENSLHIEGWQLTGNAITNTTKLYSIKRANTGSGPYEFKGNGVLLNSGAASNGAVWTLDVGASINNEYSKVFVPEVFIYNRDLSPAEIQRLESYMALKYGITLNNGNTDYVASDGTTLMWTAAANTGYASRITGIGRDDCTMLNQKQSLSADTGTVTIAIGNTVEISNMANANTITNDKTFLVFGDNNGSLAFNTPVTGVISNTRMARVFKVQKSVGWGDQDITLKIKGASESNYLLISTDPTFATIAQELQLDAGGAVTLSSSLLTNGIYFTVGALVKGPNNVTAGIAMWLRADDGTATGAQWNDFSGNAHSASQAVAARQPVVNANGFNFHPLLKFNGAGHFMTAPSLMTQYGTANLAVFAVASVDVVQNANLLLEYANPAGSVSNPVNIHLPWSDNMVYWDAPYGYRVAAPFESTLTHPYMWAFTRTPSNMSIFKNARTLTSVNGSFNNLPGYNRIFTIGGSAEVNTGNFNGKIAEYIVYNNAASMTATDRQKIQSYLAIKYGITLDQTVATDYLASDATVYWNATANSAYSKHITGIGLDTITALYQKQSRSVDTGFVTIALGDSVAATNAANAGTIANDKSFFVFGDNGAPIAYSNAVTGLPAINVTLGRVWKVQKTNWADQDITLRTDTAYDAPQYLVISTDASFGAGDLVLPLTNGQVTLNTSLVPDGAYFTFGNALKAPGYVTNGIAAWWRADVNASAATWHDYSGNGKTLTQPNANEQPSLLDVDLNYHPAVKFHNRAFFNSASLFGTASIDNIAIFAVSAADGPGANGAGSGLFSEYVSNNDRVAAWAPYSNGFMYFYAPNSWVVQSSSVLASYANPRYNLLGFTKNPSQLNIYFNNNLAGTANGTFTGLTGNNRLFFLGAYDGPDWFNGRIAEFVVYNNSSAMTATDRLKIQSYLALKYGITLSPLAPTDYLASDGTAMWTAADNTGFGWHITGIGRDDSSALYQKQSISADTGIVTIAVGNTVAVSNNDNTGVIANNLSFFTFGDNGASASYVTPVSGIDSVNHRMARIFKVDKTNWADQYITLKLKGGNAQTYLLISADTIFDAGDAAYVLNADSTVTLNSSNLPDGAYFTFATFIKGPNAITKGLNFWLRADDGHTSGAAWTDYAGYGHQMLQPTVASQPITDAKGINFNYSLHFDGGNDFLDNITTRVHPDSSTIFVVAAGTGLASTRNMLSSGAPNGTNGMEFRLGAANSLEYLENDGVSIQSIGGSNVFIENRPYIFSGIQSNTANGTAVHYNFTTDNQGTLPLSPNTPNFVSIGSRTIGSRAFFWQGNISEVIVYDRVLLDAERQSVSSYLALKYGITLNYGETDYIASDNTVYWAADPTYRSRITGIGRDDSTALNTKQSLSADTGFVTVALGAGVPLTNELNTGVITNDRSFFVFGDNGLSASNFTEVLSGSAHNVTRRMARVWMVQKTNWADQDITFKITPIGIENYMLISSDPTFATFSQEIPVAADGTITFSSSLFTGTDIYFTFGAPLKSPGGVSGHAVWVRADIGTSTTTDNATITGWNDLSAFSQTFVQGSATALPTFRNNTIDNINFNPVVRFGGAGYSLTASSILKTNSSNGAAIFAVASQSSALNSSIFYELTGVNDALNLHATWGDNIVYFDAPRVPNRILLDVGNINNQINLWSGTSDITLSTNKQELMRNGTTIVTGNNNGLLTGNNSSAILGETYDGRLPEVIVYTSPITATDRQKINSYLALKYGITLNEGNTSYLATDGSTIWDATVNAAYKNNIAGIGRDDDEALTQKQSASINAGTQVVIGLGSIDSTNMDNPNSFTADKSYLIWGDDNGALSFRTAVTGTTLVNYRMGRIWKVQETGAVGNVVVAIPANAIANPTASYIIVSNDETFDGTDAFTQLTPITINNQEYYSASVDLADGQYFTFANDLKIPGGVVGNTLWLRPDYGTSSVTDSSFISEWNDFGADINNAVQANAAAQPLYMNNAAKNINFNPVISFNGSNQFMDLDITKLPMGTSARTLIGVGRPNSITGTNKYILSWGAGITSQGSALGSFSNGAGVFGGYSDDLPTTSTSFWIPNQPNVLVNVFDGNGGAATIYSKGVQMAGPVNKNWNTQGTVARVGNSSFAPTQPEFWNGTVGDVIVYPFALNAGQRLKVETYLGIKYGYTIDQTVANNYLATDSSVIWDATANATYRYGITGIGRDDLEGLNQKQSHNIDTTRLSIAIGLGALAETNLANTNSFAADKSYLIWGDDNGDAAFKTVVTGNNNVNYRMTRLWTVQETGTVGEVEVAFPFDALPNPRQSYLVVSNDATIDAGDTYIPLYDITVNGKTHWAAKTDFSNGQFFTVAAFIKSPGGVGATSLWVRADQGINNNTDGSAVDVWVDYGNEVNNANQLNTALQPVFKNNATENVNYNPVVVFNGTSQYMNLDIAKLPMGTTARTLVGVGALNNVGGNRYIIGYGAAVNGQGMGLANSGGLGYFVGYANDVPTAAGFWQLNTINELFGTWAGAGGAANLYSKMNQQATTVNKAWNTTGTLARLGSSSWAGDYWSGPVTEVIVFDRELNNNERQRVSTYLAIRNGYTMNQSTPYSSYVNTNGTIIWDATANAAYGNNIAGIGRDDIEGLNQKQARSIQSGAILAIGLGGIEADNASNTRSFVSDTSYLLWGSNSNAITTTTADMPGRFNRRLTQEWKVSLSNFDNQLQPVTMQFDLTGITHEATAAADFTLLIDTDGDGDFTTGTLQQITASTYDDVAGTVTFDNISSLTSGMVFTLAIGPETIKLTTKVILQGAWNGTAMSTALKPVLPATDPYGQGTTPSVSPSAASAQVVDWVLVELRDTLNPTTVVAARAGFLLANGDVVDTSFTQPLGFTGIAEGHYKVAIRHRNHLGVMTLEGVDFSSGAATVDFTNSATATWGTHAQTSLAGGVMGLWAGDVNGDQLITHSAKPSDATVVAHAVLTHEGNTSSSPDYTGFSNVYHNADVNLDGHVRYTATPSDQAIITNNVKTHPANTFGLSSFIITQQLP